MKGPNQHTGPQPAEVRFWEKVRKTDGEGCWEWTAALSGNGYPVFRVDAVKRCEPGHRFIFEHVNGALLPGTEVLHRCDNPKCVRPDHLFAGTHRDNMVDMKTKGRARNKVVSGEMNRNAKLTDAKVIEMRRLARDGMTCAALGGRYGVTSAIVSRILRRLNWAHVKDPAEEA